MAETKDAGETRFSRWYKSNKDTLSKQRKQRYHTDPEYRQKIIAQNRANKAKARQARAPLDPKYTTTMQAAADEIDVSVWSLREWRKKEYYPAPHEHGSKLYFTDKQVLLLKELAKFFAVYGKRTSAATEGLRNELIAAIAANWN
jgi:hypothetical protein